ncbi:hypothetical protein ACFV4F_03385 [Kitasatospora sp. NPDC059722]|uniref:hypothetical protein n=1 Tax=Kitasatospora sp. NPDC059722 TaxID=3346925 RepID=UPI0036B30D2D
MSDTLAPAQPGAVVDSPAPQPAALASPQRPTSRGVERRAEPRLAHTRGGLPAVPLAVATGNTAVGAVSAAALVGGPAVWVALAGGTAAAAGLAAVRARRRRAARRGSSGSGSNSRISGGGSASRMPGMSGAAGHRPSAAGGSVGGVPPARGHHSRGAGHRGLSGHQPSSGPVRLTKHGTAAAPGVDPVTGAPRGALRGAGGASPNAGGSSLSGARRGGSQVPGAGAVSAAGVRAAQVRAARAERTAGAPSRRDQRVQDTAARRSVRDQQRAARQAAREEKRAAKARQRADAPAMSASGPATRSARETARSARRQARDERRAAHRQARDARADERVRERRIARRRAAAARGARRRLRRSAARYWARWAGAALLAGAVGLVGAVTTPVGRYLNLPWLMHPGRRLFARLVAAAAAAREERDRAIAAGLEEDLKAAENLDQPEPENGGEVTDTVPRAPRNHNANDSTATSTSGVPMSDNVAAFSFAAVAAEMEAMAATFDPDGMMQVLAMVEEMPDALASIANVFKLLAEKCDEEFPLDSQVGMALQEIYMFLQLAVGAAGEAGPTFRQVHEVDIRRHEDPRNGEEKWDTTNN